MITATITLERSISHPDSQKIIANLSKHIGLDPKKTSIKSRRVLIRNPVYITIPGSAVRYEEIIYETKNGGKSWKRHDYWVHLENPPRSRGKGKGSYKGYRYPGH